MLRKLFILLFFTTICHAQTLQNGWSCFDGYIGESDIVVNIFKDSIGNLDGDYCYKKYETRIKLKGKITGETLFLYEFTGKKITSKFFGKINEKDNTITGKWASATHSDKTFYLRLNSSTGNRLDSKYAMDFEDTEVELFFVKTKKAILADNKTWLSKNIEYPINVAIGKKKVKINSAKSFLANYAKIITKEYKSKIKKACVCNIFSNWQGAMIENGDVWIGETKSHKLKITALNK